MGGRFHTGDKLDSKQFKRKSRIGAALSYSVNLKVLKHLSTARQHLSTARGLFEMEIVYPDVEGGAVWFVYGERNRGDGFGGEGKLVVFVPAVAAEEG